jgi:hypothetical protein
MPAGSGECDLVAPFLGRLAKISAMREHIIMASQDADRVPARMLHSSLGLLVLVVASRQPSTQLLRQELSS